MTDERGFGLELESDYGDSTVTVAGDWWSEGEANFSINPTVVTKRGRSRMNKKARAGISKPSGSLEADADLQRIGYYFRGYLDEYKFTAAADTSGINTHEFWGGEGKTLQSFRAVTMDDSLRKYIFGILIDSFSFEASDDSLTISSDTIYKTEKAAIIGQNGATFTKPADLEDDLFVMFYDILVKLNNKSLLGDDGIVTNASFEGNNNLSQDDSIGFGSRNPQAMAAAGSRENKVTITMTLVESILEDILAMEYGEVGALEPSSCKILNVPLEFDINLCEYAGQSLTVLFPNCTVVVSYDKSGTEVIKVNLELDTLGSDTVTLADEETEVVTDMYVCLLNKQGELSTE